MRAVVAAAMLLGQPEPPSDAVQGVVLRQDGSPAAGSRVELRCGEWHQALDADAAGAFAWTDVPVEPCTLVARSPESSGAGISLDVPVERRSHVAVILPSPLTAPRAPASTVDGIGLDLVTRAGRQDIEPGSTKVTGVSSWSTMFDPTRARTRADEWTAGVRFSTAGPLGTPSRAQHPHDASVAAPRC